MTSHSHITLCCNSYISFCIDYRGFVYCFGKNEFALTGKPPTETIISPPYQIPNLTNIIMISLGSHHCVCLNNLNEVYSFGINSHGQLGVNKSINKTHEPQLLELPPIRQVCCGNDFTLCLTVSGDIYSFGSNKHAQLGHETCGEYNEPKKIESLCNIDLIECGGNHAMCTNIHGKCFSWGENNTGQLGNGTCDKITKINAIENLPNDIISIKGSNFNSFFLTSSGLVFACGGNYYGQTGINDSTLSIYTPTLIPNLPEIKRIECGNFHAMFICFNDNLWLFGYNATGQLGLGDIKKRHKPVKHPKLSDILDISHKGFYSIVKTTSNEIYGFGKNEYQQLGIESKKSKRYETTPKKILKSSEHIWASNYGNSRQKSARK